MTKKETHRHKHKKHDEAHVENDIPCVRRCTWIVSSHQLAAREEVPHTAHRTDIHDNAGENEDGQISEADQERGGGLRFQKARDRHQPGKGSQEEKACRGNRYAILWRIHFTAKDYSVLP